MDSLRQCLAVAVVWGLMASHCVAWADTPSLLEASRTCSMSQQALVDPVVFFFSSLAVHSTAAIDRLLSQHDSLMHQQPVGERRWLKKLLLAPDEELPKRWISSLALRHPSKVLPLLFPAASDPAGRTYFSRKSIGDEITSYLYVAFQQQGLDIHHGVEPGTYEPEMIGTADELQEKIAQIESRFERHFQQRYLFFLIPNGTAQHKRWKSFPGAVSLVGFGDHAVLTVEATHWTNPSAAEAKLQTWDRRIQSFTVPFQFSVGAISAKDLIKITEAYERRTYLSEGVYELGSWVAARMLQHAQERSIALETFGKEARLRISNETTSQMLNCRLGRVLRHKHWARCGSETCERF